MCIRDSPGTPSTNTNGEVPPFKDEIPRSIICVLPVGSPEGKEIFSPATLPCISWPASVTAPFTKLSDFTLEIALVKMCIRDRYILHSISDEGHQHP